MNENKFTIDENLFRSAISVVEVGTKWFLLADARSEMVHITNKPEDVSLTQYDRKFGNHIPYIPSLRSILYVGPGAGFFEYIRDNPFIVHDILNQRFGFSHYNVKVGLRGHTSSYGDSRYLRSNPSCVSFCIGSDWKIDPSSMAWTNAQVVKESMKAYRSYRKDVKTLEFLYMEAPEEAYYTSPGYQALQGIAEKKRRALALKEGDVKTLQDIRNVYNDTVVQAFHWAFRTQVEVRALGISHETILKVLTTVKCQPPEKLFEGGWWARQEGENGVTGLTKNWVRCKISPRCKKVEDFEAYRQKLSELVKVLRLLNRASKKVSDAKPTETEVSGASS